MTGMEKPDDAADGREQDEISFSEGFTLGDGQSQDEGGEERYYDDNDDGRTDASVDEGQAKEDAGGTGEALPVPEHAPAAPSLPGEAHYAEPAKPDTPPVQVPNSITLPEHLAEEHAELKKLNPEAAALALEDSPEGEAIRARLEQYGAALAEDRARQALYERKQAAKHLEDEQRHREEAIRRHNDFFIGTMQRAVPEFMAMMNDPARKAEAMRYQQDIYRWIEAKPYSEAASLMEVARSGRDPVRVADLIKRFESERKGRARQPDPTGALAIPARGAPVAPAGIGDRDDFDAGWNANAST